MGGALHAVSGSAAEDMFIELFSDTFGAEKAGFLYSQYHFYDIYNNDRYADFLIENGIRKIAIEIDDEASHHPSLVSQNKFWDIGLFFSLVLNPFFAPTSRQVFTVSPGAMLLQYS